MKLAWLALVLVACCGMARAEDSCPALERVDAEQAVGAFHLAVSWRGGTDYVCRFSGAEGELTVTVKPYRFQNGWASYQQKCIGPPSAVPGIGDQAVQCSAKGTAEILGHARDTYLEVQLTSSTPNSGDRLRRAATKVAANLF